MDAASVRHLALRDIGQLLIPPQGAANYFSKMKFEADAIGPPSKLPAPKLPEAPRATPDAELRRAAEEDGIRQMRMGIKKGYPSLVQVVATQLRCVLAGELAGPREDFGGIGS